MSPEAAPPAADPALLLFAHGSRAPETSAFVQKLCDRVQRMAPRLLVAHAFLEGSPPTLAQSVEALRDQGARRIRVVPLLLAPGRHLTHDFPRELELVRQRHPELRLELTALPTEHDRFLEILLDYVRG